MTGTFKANNPLNNFLLFIYGLLIKLPMFLFPVIPVTEQPDGFFYRVLLGWIKPAGDSFPFLYPIITFLLLYSQAIMLNKVVNDQRLLSKPNYLTGMSYLLITSLFSEWHNLSAPLIINSLMIWVFTVLCRLHNSQNPKTVLFNLGLLLGLATFFYFPSIAFSILIIAGLFITRPFKLPEWVIVMLGILTPYYFSAAWLYLNDRWHEFHVPDIALTVPILKQSTWAYIGIALIILAIVVGTFFIQHNIRRQLVHTRKNWGLVYLYLLVAVIVPFLNETDNFEYWILMAVPISIIAASAFLYPERKWFAFFIHWSMVALIIIMEYIIR